MPKRTKVELYEQIRRVHEREGLSIRALERRFKTHRRSVREALASAVPPERKVPDRVAPVLDPWKATIEEWLAADAAAPKKQRHTARRVWQRLVDERGAEIGESTVRRYVTEVRRRRELPLVEIAVPQTHELGEEAEVDFGTITAYVAELPVELRLFIMRLSASGRSFPRAYLNESQDVFLDAHVRAFDHFGGIPGRIRYDNLKAAVERVLKGRNRKEADRFVALRSHYGFETFFCTPGPGGAHEKGGVEGEIGRFRRRHLVPVPRVSSVTELNEVLMAAAMIDDRRHIASRQITVGDHFALEQRVLRPLPDDMFDTTTMSNHRVDTKSRVCVRLCHYSVPVRYSGRRLDVRVGAETIEVLDGSRVVAAHTRGRKGEEHLVLDHYLEVLALKPGALLNATALVRARAAGSFTPTHERFWGRARRRLGDRDGTKMLIEILLAHRQLPADALIAGMTAALSMGSVDPGVVFIEARKHAAGSVAPVIPIGAALARYDRPVPALDRYDQLLLEAE
jgi:transposase